MTAMTSGRRGATLDLARKRSGPRRPTGNGDTVESMRSRVLAAVRKASRNPDVRLDKDGDVEVGFGSAVVYVRVHEKPRYVSLFSPVLSNVEPGPQVSERLGELNSRLRYGRLFWVDGTVMAAIDLFATPLVVEHVVQACRILGEMTDELDEGLQAQLGGRTAFGGYQPRSMMN